VAFKPTIDDARKSPAERVIELLLSRGAGVRYHDPYVPHFRLGGDVFHRERQVLDSVSLMETEIAAADCVVIVTGHHSVDYRLVVEHADLVVDTCNVTAVARIQEDASDAGLGHKVVRLGAPLPG
jgi:UDP-N-acetyl-D-glucosamine dehydrogenase